MQRLSSDIPPNFRMTSRSVLTLLLAATVFPVLLVEAQDAARARAVPAVSVTATRARVSILDVPLAVTLVGGEQLRVKRGVGLDEALSLVPGVVAQSRSGGGDVRLSIRGFGARGAGDRSNAGTSRGVRILIDGIPETEPDGRTSLDLVDLALVEDVEIVRSNASALYGNAAGGVLDAVRQPGRRRRSAGGQRNGSRQHLRAGYRHLAQSAARAHPVDDL